MSNGESTHIHNSIKTAIILDHKLTSTAFSYIYCNKHNEIKRSSTTLFMFRLLYNTFLESFDPVTSTHILLNKGKNIDLKHQFAKISLSLVPYLHIKSMDSILCIMAIMLHSHQNQVDIHSLDSCHFDWAGLEYHFSSEAKVKVYFMSKQKHYCGYFSQTSFVQMAQTV